MIQSIQLLRCAIIVFLCLQFNILYSQQHQRAYLDSLAQVFEQREHMLKADLKKIPKRDRPDLAWEQDFLLTKDPATGKPERDRLVPVYKGVALKKQQSKRSPGDGDAPWVERGPDNIGGRTRAIVWDLNTEHKVWAGGVTGGLWYNNDITNASSQWTAVDDFWDNIAITTIAIDPTDTDVMYVGTGEGWGTGASRGAGIWKSTDGGNSWNQLAASTGFYYVNDILIRDESGTGVVYVGCDRKAYQGAFHGSSGLFRSTDGGVSFTEHLGMPAGSTREYTVAELALGANDRLWLGTAGNSQGFGGGKIKYSDDGTTWTTVDSVDGADRVAIAAAPSDSNYIYAIYESANIVERIRYTSNHGNSWSDATEPADVDTGISDTDFSRGQAWYDLVIAVDPNDKDVILVGGIDLFRSEDNGANWEQISKWSNNNNLAALQCSEVHADQHAIVFKPGSSDTVLFGNDGGVYYTGAMNSQTDSNDVISNSVNGYNVTQFYGCAMHPTAGENYYLAGSQDNGSLQFASAGVNSVTEVTGGDGAICHIDQTEPDYQITQYVYNNVYLSTNGGSSFSQILSDNSSGRFINPSDYDNNQNVYYSAYSTTQVKRILDVTGTPTDDEITITGMSAMATHLSVSPFTTSSTTLYVGNSSGELFRVTDADGTPSITQIDQGTFSGSISSVAFGNSEDSLIVTLYNYGITSVYFSEDGGTSWSSKEGDLPDMPIRWALRHPTNVNEVILATEVGVWSTTSFGSASPTWTSSNSGLANVRVDMLQMRESDFEVIAATHGRGLFSGTGFADDGSVPTSAFNLSSDMGCVDQSISFLDASTGAPSSWSWVFTGGDIDSSSSQNPVVTFDSAGTYQATLTASNVNGSGGQVQKTFFISDAPETACTVETSDLANSFGLGIFNLTVASIDNSSSGSVDDGGYQDLTCSNTTELVPDSTYDISVTVGGTNPEDVRVYIDYDNNGTLSESELVFSSDNATGVHSGTFTTPSSITTGQMLRLRVITVFRDFNITSSCHNPTYGQVEDYGVYFLCDVPEANFAASDSSICAGDDITFSDSTTNSPNAWTWTFTGGDTTISSAQNPVVRYDTAGTYAVALTATNSCTSDTETKTAFITVEGSHDITENVVVFYGDDYTYPDLSVSSNITASESHVSNLTSNAGCDSIVTTNVLLFHKTIQSGDFDLTANWYNSAVPGTGDYAWVDNDDEMDLTQTQQVGFMYLDTGAVLNLGEFTLDLTDSLIALEGTASFAADSGTVLYSGTARQSIAGLNYYDLELGGSDDKVIAEAASVTNALTVTGTNIELTTNDVLTILSDSVSTGYVGEIPAGFSFVGNVTIQRYIQAQNRSWWHMTVPVNNVTVDDWQEELPITGPFAGSNDLGGSNGTSMYWYDEDDSSNGLDDGWIDFPGAAGDSSTTLTNGLGYRMYLRSNGIAALGGVTLTSNGTLNSANVTLPVTYDDNGDVAADGWNLVGNPYASTIDWEDAEWTKTNIDSAIYVWDAINSQYGAYIDGIGTNHGSRYIAQGQAFWVHATASLPEVTATQGVKVTNSAPLYRTSPTDNTLRLTVTNSNWSTDNVVRFVEGASTGFDASKDAYFVYDQYALKLATYITGDEFFAINTLGENETSDILLWIEVPDMDNRYNLSITGLDTYTLPDRLVLKDLFTGIDYELSHDFSLDFDVSSADPLSDPGSRFVLSKTDVITSVDEQQEVGEVEVFPNPVTRGLLSIKATEEIRSVVISDLSGLIQVKQKGAETRFLRLDLSALAAGVYSVEVVLSDGQVIREKVVLE